MDQLKLNYVPITESLGAIEYSVVNMTPELAKKYLALSKFNRKIKQGVVRDYAHKMKNGEWRACTDPISVDECGCLINGHHRLMAVVQSGETVPFLLASNVPKNSVFDRGAIRSIGDTLYMQGAIPKEFSNRNTIAVARNYYQTINNLTDSKPSEDEIGRIVNKYGALIHETIAATEEGESRGRARLTGIRVALLGALIHGYPRAMIRKFCEIINTGVCQYQSQTAAIAVMKFVMNNGSRGRGNLERVMLVTEAWLSDFLKGKERVQKYNPDRLKHIYVIKDVLNE